MERKGGKQMLYECPWCHTEISKNDPKQFRGRVRAHVLTHVSLTSGRVEIEMDKVKRIIQRQHDEQHDE